MHTKIQFMDQVTASEVAHYVGGRLVGSDGLVNSPAPIFRAGPRNLSFVSDWRQSRGDLSNALDAGATVFAAHDASEFVGSGGALILVENPRAAFAEALARFFIDGPVAGIAESAVVHSEALIDASATIGHFTVIRAGAKVGPGVEIRDHVVVGRNVRIGQNCLIKSHAVIGEEGFGVEKDEDGNNFAVPQIGSVQIGCNVQVGNFTTVCSGALEPTKVGDFTKISDHVHIAHNCQIGRNAIITAGVVFAGSVAVGDEVWVGPGATVRDRISIGSNAFIGIGSNVVKSVPAGERWAGNPAHRLP